MCYPVYVRRESDPIIGNRIVAKITEYYEKYGVMVRRILADPLELSSTEIREAVRKNEDIGRMVSPEVAHYIKENGLYV